MYLCGRWSCGVTEGATGGRNSRVCGDVGEGGARGRIVQERGVGITGESGRSGRLDSRIDCGHSGGRLRPVVGTVVGG